MNARPSRSRGLFTPGRLQARRVKSGAHPAASAERSAVLDHPDPKSLVRHRIRLELQPQVVVRRI